MLATALLLLPVPVALPQDQVLTLEQASGRQATPSFGARAASYEWATDGYHLRFGPRDEAKYLDPETLQEVEAIPMGMPEGPPQGLSQAQIRAALEELEGVDAERADRLSGRRAQRAADGSVVAALDQGAILVVRAEGSAATARRIPTSGHSELLRVSADGSQLAWVADNDLWIAATDSGKARRLTDNGGPEFFNGKLDWVYQEEIYGRGNFLAHWWSPDGRYLAFLALDEEAVHSFTLVDHIEDDTFRVKAEVTNYPKSGDPNPTVQLGIADARNGKVQWVDLGEYAGEEALITRVGWDPQGARCLFVVANRIQTYAHLRSVAPGKRNSKLLIAESNDSGWTNRPAMPRWLDDGSFLWESDRGGNHHVYHYRADGKLLRAITSGDWSVNGIRAVDEENGRMWFSSTHDGAVDRNLYRIQLDGSDMLRLTTGEGSHAATFNHDRRWFLDRVSSLSMPEEVRLCDADGQVLKVLDRATVPAAVQFRMGQWELHEIQARDGTALDVAVLKPVPFDADAQYPVWISTYSGPNAPTVRNRWNGSAWNQFLAQHGVIVLNVNVNTASGKGMWSTTRCYKQLGVRELQDLEDTVDWLCANPWADAERVGITGYSYGGFMSAYALVASDKFALGVAGGGVYDWGMYDTVYTERYMSTPQDNAEGYALASCLNKAGQLHGFLHMHHGVMDDNVHVQNLMQMVLALQKAGQTNWSMMVYPQNRHGIRDADQRWHARQLEWRLIQEHLRPAGAPEPQ